MESRSYKKFFLLSACIILLPACEPTNAPNPPQAIQQTPVVEPLQIVQLTVRNVGEDKQPLGPQIIKANSRLEVLMKTHGVASGLEVEAKLFDLANGQVVASAIQMLEIRGPASTPIVLEGGEKIHPGRHLLEFRFNGKLVAQRDVEIAE